MNFSTMQYAHAAKKIFAVALLAGGLAGCASESGDTAAPSAVREPPTSPVNPPTNAAPVISGNPATSAQVGVTYTFQPTATDAETPSGQLVYSISGCPVWATCTNGSGTNAGRITGMPQTANIGPHTGIVVSVMDPEGNSTALQTFSITVSAAANQAPTITGIPPASVQVNSAYSFTPTVTDPDGPSRSFTFANFPAWITTRNASTGLISGTPVAGQEGAYSNLRITVSDGTNSRTLGPFTITVTALPTTNQPPVISGTPTTTRIAEQAYSFTPTASDPDGDTPNGGGLTFSINTMPAWQMVSFNNLTGELSGVAEAGLTSNIRISVTDRQGATATLPAFSITVQASAPTGTTTLNWAAPTANTDMTQLLDLAGFRLVWGRSASTLTQEQVINNSTTTSYTVNGLASGTWYFAVRAINASQMESDLSNVISRIIP
jgi:hypothetical protein